MSAAAWAGVVLLAACAIALLYFVGRRAAAGRRAVSTTEADTEVHSLDWLTADMRPLPEGGWQVAVVRDLAAASDLIDRLEIEGYAELDVIVDREKGVEVRWR